MVWSEADSGKKIKGFSAGENDFADSGITYVSWNPSGNYTLIIPIQRRYFCHPNTCNMSELRAVFDRDSFSFILSLISLRMLQHLWKLESWLNGWAETQLNVTKNYLHPVKRLSFFLLFFSFGLWLSRAACQIQNVSQKTLYLHYDNDGE